MGKCSRMVDADSAVDLIKDELNKPSVLKWVRGKVTVHLLRKYRDWKSHVLAHAPVEFASW